MFNPDGIVTGLQRLGLPVVPEDVSSLAAHTRAVIDANKDFNLTAVREEDALVLHILDSCAAAPFLAKAPPGPFADLGSGAGYPGIPLAILSRRTVALVESVKKKAAFLERVTADLCLEATVHPVRAEELAQEVGGMFSAVTARALSALPSLVELAAPLLVRGGHLICLKGKPEGDEVRRGDAAASLCGMRRIESAPIVVPGLDAARTIVVYEHSGKAAIRLPRRNGMAQRQPLA